MVMADANFVGYYLVDGYITDTIQYKHSKWYVFWCGKECNMIAAKQMDVRANIKKYFDLAFNGEPVIVSRKENKNVVIISEAEYNDLAKARKNAEYLAKLNRADEQIGNGQVITKTMDELLAMEE